MPQTLWDRLIEGLTASFDNRSLYGDGTADITYSADATISANVYARTLNIQPGVVLTIDQPAIPIFLYARERIWNRGFIRSNGDAASGMVAGGSGAYGGKAPAAEVNAYGLTAPTAPVVLLGDLIGDVTYPDVAAYLSATAPGAGGATPDFVNSGSVNWRATGTPALFNIHTPNEYFVRLLEATLMHRPQGGSAGRNSGRSNPGAGGEAGGFIGLIAPEIDNWDGIVEAKGGAGGNAAAGTSPTTWAASSAYTALASAVIPTTPNGFVYIPSSSGTSAASEPTWPTTVGATVVDGTVTWENAGATGAAGGGGGGWGGVVAAICRQWNGGAPILTGGAGGTPLGTGSAGVAGGEGYWIKVLDR